MNKVNDRLKIQLNVSDYSRYHIRFLIDFGIEWIDLGQPRTDFNLHT